MATSTRAGDELSFSDPIQSIVNLFTSPTHYYRIASLLLIAESILCFLIVRFIPYTEIDWTTYHQQVQIFLSGERDYSLIKGSTGPLVYPAGFLYVYSALGWATDGGKDIKFAQFIFAQIYLVELGMLFILLKRSASVPPYMLIFMTLSKRLHSIYVLRLFNDGVGMLFFYAALLAFTTPKKPRWTVGYILFSVALSMKMNFLLYLPALLYLSFTTLSPIDSVLHLLLTSLTLVIISFPFISTSEHALTYFHTSFDFSRKFLWQWTVNWRWIGQETFESEGFGNALLIAHVVGLALFVIKWSEGDAGGLESMLRRAVRYPSKPAGLVENSPDRFLTIVFSANLLGITFARSLHYQFYAWYAHQLVFLVLHTPYDLLQQIALLVAIEFGWNVFPSTLKSSMALTFANAIIWVGVYYHAPTGLQITRRVEKKATDTEPEPEPN